MGYDNFQFGEQLNPSEFNDKFEKLFDLVKKAYEHNNQLRNRLDVLNIAFKQGELPRSCKLQYFVIIS